jgi:D-beta-D-heptose 7-phosphate kinase/D-beta-D-heptose 1-phosphate adenosyltransferase
VEPDRSAAVIATDAILERMPGRRVAVIGDVMLDHFIFGRVDRISPEAPVPIVRFDREEYRLGGAANVAHNIAALGGVADLVGLVGDDEAGRRLQTELAAADLGVSGLIVDPARVTTRKVRIATARNQQVTRVDYESDGDPPARAQETLDARARVAVEAAEAVVISDYRKGVVTAGLIAHVASRARETGVPLLIDPKIAQADRYRGATVLTPNHHEAELMTQTVIRRIDDARAAARTLHDRTGASVLITWGEHGMFVLDTGGGRMVETALPAAAREVADVTGAGDTVIATLAMCLASGATLTDAATLANAAAGIVVSRFGPSAATRAEIAGALSGRN